ncbi:hypothetical protein [Tuwongella immobilis]|uniref:AP2/ERF domain-containing protein n=1 Tax=Tuwongella immobilis TaxID=692036 RepID=A0A6C2YP28_9BACT|nr:hypothetical protein [Tuwongella immobilis]VIP03051.1 unnamed protein product [Tuwongella immobilis]VTS03240.1 unnamed protein product [Tuwongella immobilis]
MALPGTDAKIQVMAERASRREQLFHPLDATVTEAVSYPAPASGPPIVHGRGSVTWDKHRRKFRARISTNLGRLCLGRYSTRELAAAAIDRRIEMLQPTLDQPANPAGRS